MIEQDIQSLKENVANHERDIQPLLRRVGVTERKVSELEMWASHQATAVHARASVTSVQEIRDSLKAQGVALESLGRAVNNMRDEFDELATVQGEGLTRIEKLEAEVNTLKNYFQYPSLIQGCTITAGDIERAAKSILVETLQPAVPQSIRVNAQMVRRGLIVLFGPGLYRMMVRITGDKWMTIDASGEVMAEYDNAARIAKLYFTATDRGPFGDAGVLWHEVANGNV